MAKKKFFSKNTKPDWKFIVLLLGILLVGLSVFVLNQKVTYKSSAQQMPQDYPLGAHSCYIQKQGCYNQCGGSTCRRDCDLDYNRCMNMVKAETDADKGGINGPCSEFNNQNCLNGCHNTICINMCRKKAIECSQK